MIDIEKAYKNNIFNNITLKTNARRIAISGRNGIGKTTFLLQFMKVDTNAKKFNIFGEDLLQNGTIRNFSIVMQEAKTYLHPLLDIGRYILYLSKDNGILEAKEKTLLLCDKFELDEEIWHKYPHELSIGQAKKISFIIALLKNPKLLILDELNAGVDSSSLNKMIDYLSSLNTCVILASHDKKFLDFCDERYEFFKDGLKCY